jgi:hypothetical protein
MTKPRHPGRGHAEVESESTAVTNSGHSTGPGAPSPLTTAPVCFGARWGCAPLTIDQLVERGRVGRCCVLLDLDQLPEVGDPHAA